MTGLECLIGGALLFGIPFAIVVFADVATDVWMGIKDWAGK